MPLTRRALLGSLAATTLVPALAGATSLPRLQARPGRRQLAPEGYPDTEIWGYDGIAPGPVIRVAQGARVQRQLVNALTQATAVHWHGIRIDNAMDGVPHLTQAAVEPGASFDYDFTVPDAGSYWYHAHNHSSEQVARGLHGLLIVDEADAPDVDHDLPLAIDDWRLERADASISGGFDNMHDLSHEGRLGNLVTVNGSFDPSVKVARGDRLRLRLANVANARIFEIGLNGLEGWLMALDGMPLEQVVPVSGSFTLAPAQRADLIVDVTGEAADLLSIEPGGGYGLMRFEVAPGTRARRGTPAALPPNPLPVIANAAAAPLHTMRLMGGMMSGMAGGRLGSTEMNARELAQLGKFWALNGQVDMGHDPFLDLSRGETLRIAFVNETVFPHGMHTHGHHFRTIAADGSLGPWRDTVLVQPRETVQIAMVADNPGKWMLHCHMLEHAAAGMMSWFRVT